MITVQSQFDVAFNVCIFCSQYFLITGLQRSVRLSKICLRPILRSKPSQCDLLVRVCVCVSSIHYSFDFIQNNIFDSGSVNDLVAQRSHCQNIMTIMAVSENTLSVLLKGGCRSILRLRLHSFVFNFKYINLTLYKYTTVPVRLHSHIALPQIGII